MYDYLMEASLHFFIVLCQNKLLLMIKIDKGSHQNKKDGRKNENCTIYLTPPPTTERVEIFQRSEISFTSHESKHDQTELDKTNIQCK